MRKKFLLPLFFAGFSGCAQLMPPPEEVVRERSQARLNALIDDEVELAYSFSTPSYRSSVPIGAYYANFAGAGAWTKATVSKVECQKDVCDVSVLVTYKLTRLGIAEHTRPLKEKWLNVDGEWWIYTKIN